MIKARNIIKSYQNGESRFQVLKDISLDIEDNDLWLFSAHLVLASQPF
ncbi:hypothetical protein COPCOM_00143 [Coprococcus comes ATCC 27758]|uniref:Uncharacterized protein n=1 Tax=Coprococcus comes ATCC 27758 TaxID=470146 RepID=C0B4S6_9FIRM|nr:hypothetical protein COPCOM_00143 [Coprococcus comes ATCC 27758]